MSLSKTDSDATFMRLKDDHMKNGQLKAAYNIQCGTENQFIVSSTIHQRPNDTACTIPHLEHVKEAIGHIPRNMVADAGYGSEENYAYLEDEGITAYVKHAEFFRECKKKYREDEMRVANWAPVCDCWRNRWLSCRCIFTATPTVGRERRWRRITPCTPSSTGSQIRK